MTCGILGTGFVGEAITNKFQEKINVETFDIIKHSSCKSLKDLFDKSEFIFICLPTPMKEDGSCDLSNVHDSLYELNKFSEDIKSKKIVVIKSTIPVGSTRQFQKIFKSLDIFFSPEFLTEANHIKDFENQNRIIIGGENKNKLKLINLHSEIFPNAEIIDTDSLTAEMVKYFANTFLATKVSFANEMFNFCTKLGINYNEVVKYVLYDTRIGPSHLSVPGPDNKKGYGGSCFPKDIASLIFQFEQYNVKSFILKASWQRNNEVDRTEKDWKKLKGRSVVD
tara:strand:- start:2128 stop:2970 length:843 start_codon:yes stop_codon:yes gene_type:complete